MTHEKYQEEEHSTEKKEQRQKASGETVPGLFEEHKEASMVGIQLHLHY